jgi:hypothetical protein
MAPPDMPLSVAVKNAASNRPLVRLRALAAVVAAFSEITDQALAEQVKAARAPRGPGAKGASWREVGEALGVSHTEAQRRYAVRARQ